ncbi:helix-turn-helix domain-containing protein [Bosea thiooxidans]
MAKSFGELIAEGISRTEDMDPLKLAAITGLSRNRIYQVLSGQGGVPRKWWVISDSVNVGRGKALLSFSEPLQKTAYSYLEKAGEAASVNKSVVDMIARAAAPAPPKRTGNLSNVKWNGLSPAQSRAARALLGWSQFDLSDRSGLSQSAISHFESEAVPLELSSQNLLWAAFTDAGVLIVPRGKLMRGGDGVRFADPN